LLSGQLLDAARRYAQENPGMVGKSEQEFLEASQQHENEEQARAGRRLVRIAVTMIVLALVAIVAAALAFAQSQLATEQYKLAEASRTQAEMAATEASAARDQATAAQATAEARATEVAGQKLQTQQQLVTIEALDRMGSELDLGLLLSVQAVRLGDTLQ